MGVNRGRVAFVAMALFCAWGTPIDAQLLPTGDEFLVNSYTTSSQVESSLSATTPGDFMVTWSSYGQGGDQWDIFARRFSDPTTPIGIETLVNSYTTGEQVRSSVAATSNGDFVVVWDSYYQDGSYTGAFVQRFDSAGAPVGTEFQLSSQTIGSQDLPTIGTVAGGFVIVWEDYPDPENNGGSNLFARRYDNNLIPQGTEFQVNTFTRTGFASDVIEAGGGFLVAFSSFSQDGDGGGAFARRFDSTGIPQGTEFQVNTYTTGHQGAPRASASADGSFVLVWGGEGSPDNSVRGVFGQRYDSTGTRVGTEFQVNTYTNFQQTQPDVSSNATGEFVVTWQSNGQDGAGYGIFARAFKADGTPDTPEIQVNQFTTGHQLAAEIVSVDERTVVIVWTSQAQDGAFNGLYGRRFRRAGDRLSGKKLFIKTSPSSGNTLTFVSKDAQLEAPQSAFEDPRCPPAGSGSLSSGARLRVVGAGGDFTIDLPCVNWSANAAGTRYRYRDATGTTCNAIVLRAGRLMKALCRGPQVAYTLGAPQGDVYVTLTTGDPSTNRKYCATFGPQSSATVVRDGSDGRSYRAVQAGVGVCP